MVPLSSFQSWLYNCKPKPISLAECLLLMLGTADWLCGQNSMENELSKTEFGFKKIRYVLSGKVMVSMWNYSL